MKRPKIPDDVPPEYWTRLWKAITSKPVPKKGRKKSTKKQPPGKSG